MKNTLLTTALLATSMLAGAAFAESAEPALIYDMGGKFDKSFNESAFTGAEAFAAASGGTYREFEIQTEAQREQPLADAKAAPDTAGKRGAGARHG